MISEVNKSIGAMFLTNAKFTAQVKTPYEILQPDTSLPMHQIEEILRRQMIERISKDLYSKFAKEIKKESEPFGVQSHRLELFVFTEPMFKLMLEYIISEMPEARIKEIRGQGI